MSDRLGLQTDIVDAPTLDRAVERCRETRIALPTFAQLTEPGLVPDGIGAALAGIGADDAHPLNLFRVNWRNGSDRMTQVDVPEHLVLPPALTGVEAKIVVALGDRFPMIRAHKVLAAYACLVPRLVTGGFDPTRQRAVWPSTGNYCRGGIAISRLVGCRGVAVLPEGMSRERFDWLEQWVTEPTDIVRTPGSESNVKAIYDTCAALEADPQNVILNQFAEFGNHAVHYHVTGRAIERIVASLADADSGSRLRAFVSATGSAGTIGAGDYLKDQLGSLVVAVEALECPTMLRNGFGDHNIQGIGDRHIPLIHNVLGTDIVVAVSDRATDQLGVLFSSDAGRAYLAGRRDVPGETIAGLDSLGLSSICNVLAAIKLAKQLDLGPQDVVATVATDGAVMYGSERQRTLAQRFPDGFDELAAAEVFGEHMLGQGTDNVLELTSVERDRIFNLGYYTWVEQQGISLEDFEARRDPAFWDAVRKRVHVWDELIDEFNARTGVLEEL